MIYTDEASGRRYEVGPDGQSRWIDNPPPPPPSAWLAQEVPHVPPYPPQPAAHAVDFLLPGNAPQRSRRSAERPPRGRRALLVAAAPVVVSGLALAGLWRSDGGPSKLAPVAIGSPRNVTGHLTLIGGAGGTSTACYGKGGYSDIREGTSVVLTDQAGKVIGTSALTAGVSTDTSTGYVYSCQFAFRMADVPRADFYSVEISHRGKITHSYQEMETSKWQVDLSLGN